LQFIDFIQKITEAVTATGKNYNVCPYFSIICTRSLIRTTDLYAAVIDLFSIWQTETRLKLPTAKKNWLDASGREQV
jgi:hypothetical protein